NTNEGIIIMASVQIQPSKQMLGNSSFSGRLKELQSSKWRKVHVRCSLKSNVSDMSKKAPKGLFPPEPEKYIGPKLKVAIIGSGLAGMSTAVELLDQGHEVDIYESRPFIGGKVGSYVDKRGNHVEMGLHVFFGCYNNLFRLMKKVGAEENLLVKDHTHTFINKGGHIGELDFRFLTGAPLHGIKAFLTTNQLLNFDKAANALALATSPVVRALIDPDGAMEDIRKLDGGKGEAVCAIATWLSPHILDRVEDPMSRCNWMTIMLCSKVWDLCLVYAPNDTIGRIQHWKWMAHSLPIAEWIVGSKFNMVKWDGDRVGGCETTLQPEERQVWNNCKRILGMSDIKKGQKNLDSAGSWSNRQVGNNWIQARLDRFYANPQATTFSSQGRHLVFGDSSITGSDHLSISTQLIIGADI
ncbi:hypothetical protein KI387_014009, partial [Taxus chinensis]